MPASQNTVEIRQAALGDLQGLLCLEETCFTQDRLSRRSFRRWLVQGGAIFLVAQLSDGGLAGYVLVSMRRGTRLARLYSLAVDPVHRGMGLASDLLQASEQRANKLGVLTMRLEVACDNQSAIALYRKWGYKPFGRYRAYYEDMGDAIRMEKCIHDFQPSTTERSIPWIAQSTGFTCGPASLMMAMAACDSDYQPSPREEIRIWRESTTVFMTSGHGGCHPVGLALAAHERGFVSEAWVSCEGPLFLDGVRNDDKKRILQEVHDAFIEDAATAAIPVRYGIFDQQYLINRFTEGANILILISTFRMNRKKAPHWVVVSGVDEACLYVHDPDYDIEVPADISVEQVTPMDCQHIPIALADFDAMRRYGGSRLQAAVVVERGGRNL